MAQEVITASKSGPYLDRSSMTNWWTVLPAAARVARPAPAASRALAKNKTVTALATSPALSSHPFLSLGATVGAA
jgi:hypothetical protein